MIAEDFLKSLFIKLNEYHTNFEKIGTKDLINDVCEIINNFVINNKECSNDIFYYSYVFIENLRVYLKNENIEFEKLTNIYKIFSKSIL